MPYRTDDITQDRRFRGWWPDAHPTMHSFLGVPIVSAGDIIGAFYLTDKQGEPVFSAADEAAVVLLASHAAIAIDQARLFEDSRELALTQERGRLARELHDAMSQSLFSLQLAADTAARLLPGDPDGAVAQLELVSALSAQVVGEMRAMVDGLRPADLERDGLAATLQAQLALAGSGPRRPRRARRRRAPRPRDATSSTRCCASPRRPCPTPSATRRRDASASTSAAAPSRAGSCCGCPTTGAGSTPRPGRSAPAGSGSRRCTSGPARSAATSTSGRHPGAGTVVELRFPA